MVVSSHPGNMIVPFIQICFRSFSKVLLFFSRQADPLLVRLPPKCFMVAIAVMDEFFLNYNL